MRHRSPLVVLLFFGFIHVFGVAQTPQPTPPPADGSVLGIDNSPKTYNQLNGMYTTGVSANVTNVQTQLQNTGTPGATGSIDPYKRDASGNILLDTSGNPIRKTQAEIDAEIQAGLAQTGTNTNPQSNGQADVSNYVMPTNIVPPAGNTTVPTYGLTSPVEVGPGAGDWNLAGNPWNRDHTAGLGLGSGSVTIDPSATTGLVDGIANVVTGGTPIPADIGTPGDPTVVSGPRLCKCCGAPVHPESFPVWYTVTGDVYYLFQDISTESVTRTACWGGGYEYQREMNHSADFAGPLGGVEGCEEPISIVESGGGPAWADCNGIYTLPDPRENSFFSGIEVPDSEGPTADPSLYATFQHPTGYTQYRSSGSTTITTTWEPVVKGKMSCTHRVPGTPIMKDRCEKGHWQDEACPTTAVTQP